MPASLKRPAERGLGESRPARQRQRAHVDHPFDARGLQRRQELGDRAALIADGEDAHGLDLRARCRHCERPRRAAIQSRAAAGLLRFARNDDCIRHPHHRRRPRRKRSRLAARRSGGSRCALAKCAAAARRRPRTRPTASPSWSARTAFARTTPRRMRSACSTGDARARLADHARRRPHRVPAGSALAVDRDGICGRGHRARSRRIPTSSIVRERIDALPADRPDASSPPAR